MNAHWAEQYIGLPWVFGGCTPEEGFDCWNFLRYIQAEHYDTEVNPIELKEYKAHQLSKTFDGHPEYNNWVIVNEPKGGDAAFLSCGRFPNHVGVWIDTGAEKGVLHCEEKTGVMFSNRANLARAGWKIIHYYRHKTKCQQSS